MSNKTRRERTPFSANRKRLEVAGTDDNYEYRWFNDQDDRLARAEGAGYQYVLKDEVGRIGDKEVHGGNSDLNSRVSRVVGRTDQNVGIRAYLMKIQKDFYKEDQAKKEEVNRRVDEAIRAGKAGGTAVENSYGQVSLGREAPR